MANVRSSALRGFAIAVVLCLATAGPVAALTCAQPDPWFLTTISLTGNSSLPHGVVVKVTPRRVRPNPNEPPWNDAALNWLEVENETSQPLFILEHADEYSSQMGYDAIRWPDENLGNALPGMRTRLKVQNSTLYTWPTNCAVIRCEAVEWRSATGTLMITDGTFGLSRGFQDRATRRKDRPASAAVPLPQSGELTLSYTGRALTVPFLVAYELNPNYDPARGTDNCGAGVSIIAGAFVLLLIAGIGLPVLVLVRMIVRRARTAPQ